VETLGREECAAIVARHHAPYRAAVVGWIEAALGGGAHVLHLSCHSFTPVLDGRRRDVDIGLLFDPARTAEAGLARDWRKALGQANLALRVRLNQPYRGTSDGLTTALRRLYSNRCYAGIELEVNQRYPTGDPRAWRALRRAIVRTFAAAAGVRAGRGRATNGPGMRMESRAGDVPARHRRVW
jgi:predicted N-formylglutamate amidohydrolase